MRRSALSLGAVALFAIGLSCDRHSAILIPEELPPASSHTAVFDSANGPATPDANSPLAGASTLASTITIANPNVRIGSGLLSIGNNYATLGTAQHGGVTVRIASGDPNLLKVGPNDSTTIGADYVDVFVPDGQQYAYYSLHGMEGRTGTTSITATAPGFTSATAAGMTVVPVAFQVQNLPAATTAISSNADFYARVGASSAADPNVLATVQPVRPGGIPLTVSVSNSNAAVGQLQVVGGPAGQNATLTIAAGRASTPYGGIAGGVQFDPLAIGTTVVSTTVSGANPVAGISRTVAVGTPGLTVAVYGRIGSGLMKTGNFVTLSSGNHGGVTVRVTSSDPALLKVGPNNTTTTGTDYVDIAVPAGQTNAYYSIHGIENQTGTATLTATAAGFTNRTASVVVAAPVIDLQGLPATTPADAPNTNFFARIGVSGPGNPDSLVNLQSLRAGAAPVAVTVSNSSASVARLQVIGGAAAQSHTLYINPGQVSTPQGTAGGVQFDPLAPGATTVTASAAGFNPVNGYSRTAIVTAPSMTITMAFSRIGSGLMKTGNSVKLGSSNHGGVTIRITSSDPALLKLGPDNTTAIGADYVDVMVPDGQSTAYFSVHGMENQVGTVTLTASAPGFTNRTAAVTVAAPVIELQGLPASTKADGSNAGFYARIGVSNATAPDAMANAQALRAGAVPLAVTVGNSDASVAQLQMIGGAAAQSHNVYIYPGQSSTPQGTAGGVQFDPLAAGATTVTASAAGYNPTAGYSKVVTVTAPGLTMLIAYARIGGGLSKAGNYVKLGTSNHGGVTIRIASGDPARVKIGPSNTTTPGTDYVDVVVPNGQTNAYFSIHGMENQTGTVTLTASASGFANGTAPVTVAAPVVDLQGLPTFTLSNARNTSFFARIGVSSPGSPDALANVQSLRGGALPLAITISNSNASAAQIQLIGGAAAQSHTVYIYPGQSNTPNLTGGFQFDPLAAGTTSVAVAAPGFNPVAGYIRSLAVIDHDAQFFPIFSGTHAGKVSGCQQCHTTSGTYSVFSCTTCHLQAQTTTDHALVPAYSYDSVRCYSCHPKGD